MIQGVIARRRYDRVDGRGHVEVTFFQLERDGETGDFRCPFEISGLEGVDPIRQQEGKARRVQERIASALDVVTGVPDFIWHYLSDADVRLEDPRYARMQKDMLSEVLAILEGLTSQESSTTHQRAERPRVPTRGRA